MTEVPSPRPQQADNAAGPRGRAVLRRGSGLKQGRSGGLSFGTQKHIMEHKAPVSHRYHTSITPVSQRYHPLLPAQGRFGAAAAVGFWGMLECESSVQGEGAELISFLCSGALLASVRPSPGWPSPPRSRPRCLSSAFSHFFSPCRARNADSEISNPNPSGLLREV